MNNLTYTFRENNVRVEMVNNEPWFLAKDVCEILDLNNSRQALTRLDDDEKSDVTINDGRQNRSMSVVNESGLYQLIFTSRKEEAKEFRKWVTSEVLPSIRKDGGYIVSKEDESPELIMARALMVAQKTIERNQKALKQAESKLVEQQPKVLFADAVTASSDCILIRDLAKLLKQNGIDTGEQRLYRWLRENGYIVKYGNAPTQKSMNLELFEVSKVAINIPGKEVKVRSTTKVTTKGQAYFVKKFLKAQN